MAMISYKSATLNSGPVVTLRDHIWFHEWGGTGLLRTRCKVSLLCENCARLRRECARRETLVRFPRAWMVSEVCPAAEPRSVSTVDVVCLRRFVWIATRAWCRFFPSRISSWMDQGSRWTSYLKMRESRVAAVLSEDNTVARGWRCLQQSGSCAHISGHAMLVWEDREAAPEGASASSLLVYARISQVGPRREDRCRSVQIEPKATLNKHTIGSAGISGLMYMNKLSRRAAVLQRVGRRQG